MDAGTITVTVVDPAGAPVTGVVVSITATGSNNLVVQPAVPTDAAGNTTATITSTRAETKTITAVVSDGSSQTILDQRPIAAFVAGPADRLAFGTPPGTPQTAGQTWPAFTVVVQDTYGNIVTAAANDVTVLLAGGSGALNGTTTWLAADGMARFADISYNRAESITLDFTAAGLLGSASVPVTVLPGSAAQLAFTVQPTNALTGAAIVPDVRVAVQDAYGNIVTSAAEPVTLVVGVNAGGGALTGITSARPNNGVASFPGIAIEGVGNGYRIEASYGGLPPLQSQVFNITYPTISPIVTVTNSSFAIGGVPWKARGVVYAAFPIGADGAYDYIAAPVLRQRDFPVLAQLEPGMVLRIVASISDPTFLDDADAYGFRVIAGYYIDPGLDFRSATVRTQLTSDYRQYVRSIRGHRVVLAYEIGNEVAFQIYLSSTIPVGEKADRKVAWFTLLAALAAVVGQEEGPNHRPVTSAFADLFELGVPGQSDDARLASLDFLSCNVYRETTIRNFIAELRSPVTAGRTALTKPVFISEMGVDAYDSEWGAEDAAAQRDYDLSLAQDVEAHPDVMGGAVIEYSDVWWKRGNPFSHDAASIETGASPDGFRSDEYLGLNSVSPGGTGQPDVVAQRLAFAALAELWTGSTPWPGAAPNALVEKPANGSLVDYTEYVTGTFQGLAPGTTIFAVVKAPNNFYYPQRAPVTLALASGPQRVMIGGVYFGAGPSQNIGEAFSLLLASTTDAQAVAQLLAAGQSGGIHESAWPPANVSAFPSVIVTRQ